MTGHEGAVRNRMGGVRWMLAAALAAGLLLALAATASSGNGNGLSVETQPVFDLEQLLMEVEDPEVHGTAQIVRTTRGVLGRVHVEGLTPGDIYTLWWEVFNKPKKCGVTDPGGCGVDLTDFSNRKTGLDIGFATSGKVGADGTLTLVDWQRRGRDLKGHPDAPIQVIEFVKVLTTKRGIMNTKGAQIDLILRNHGQPVKGMVRSQRTSWNGGCKYGVPFSPPESAAPRFGRPGPNTCVDLGIAIFAGAW